MTPTEELPMEAQPETPGIDCEAVKKEWDTASKTGRVSAELMQKALQCKLVPQDKVKQPGSPLPTREDNPLAGEDKELGMAELVMADDDVRPADEGIIDDEEEARQAAEWLTEDMYSNGYTRDSEGNWTTSEASESGGFDPFRQSFVGTGSKYTPPTSANVNVWGMDMSYIPTDTQKIPINIKDNEGIMHTLYISEQQMKDNSEFFSKFDQGGAGDGGRIMNTINPNYFGGNAPQKPDTMGNMEWYYRYGGGMYNNAFNPESFYFNPDDKGNAGNTSSPYTRIGNGSNMTPEVVKSNRPFYDEKGINKYIGNDITQRQKLLNMAAETDQMQTPMGAGVNQLQGQAQEVDEQIQEQLKEAIMEAGFNVVDIGLDQDGKIFVTVGQFEDSYMENAQYFEQTFELAEPQKCSKRFKAIAVTPGVYAAKDGTPVELSSEMLQNIAGLFRNKPIVLVDHELARPDSTHEGRNVGFIENSWYDPDYDAVLYKGVLNQDIDLATIAGSSIKLSYGKTPMGRHIALIPKCMTGKACYAPQDPNAVIIENAQRIEGVNMGNTQITPEIALAMKKELETINKQKESLIDSILKKEIELGTLKGNIFDRTRELWKGDVGVLLEMASVQKKEEIPSTKGKDEKKAELSLAQAIESGKVDPEDVLVSMIEKGKLFDFE